MMRRNLIIVTAGLGLGFMCLLAYICRPASSPIENHLTALCELRYPPTINGLAGYFSSDYLKWSLQGRLSDAQVNQLKDQHLEDLVALGYLQRRSFTLEGQRLKEMQLQELQQLHRRACVAKGLGAPLVRWSTDWTNTVTVLARPREVKVFEEVLRVFNSTNTPPNPQGGANGSQPFSSDTNRTPVVTASRRSP